MQSICQLVNSRRESKRCPGNDGHSCVMRLKRFGREKPGIDFVFILRSGASLLSWFLDPLGSA
jgi:hypothetical protein